MAIGPKAIPRVMVASVLVVVGELSTQHRLRVASQSPEALMAGAGALQLQAALRLWCFLPLALEAYQQKVDLFLYLAVDSQKVMKKEPAE